MPTRSRFFDPESGTRGVEGDQLYQSVYRLEMVRVYDQNPEFIDYPWLYSVQITYSK
jgi:hypothetical protein